jgi:hypothetical protein
MQCNLDYLAIYRASSLSEESVIDKEIVPIQFFKYWDSSLTKP